MKPTIQPTTLISLRQAVALVPSASRAGRPVHIQTLARWCQTGKLPAVNRNGYWFVRPEDLEQLYRPYRPVQLEPQRRPVPAHVTERLRAMGVI